MLRNVTIKHKLTLVIMLTCISALLLAGVAFVLWGRVIFRQDMVKNLSTLADVTGENCKASLSFEDAADATETLKTLRAQPSVVFAEIRNKDGQHFAHYWRDALSYSTCAKKTIRQRKNGKFSDGLLTVFADIVLDGELVGTICLRSDLEPLRAMLKRNTIIIASVVLFASIVAYLLSSAIQKVISGPILSLAAVAKTISEQKDYSVRFHQKSNDEVGLLITAFNEMLKQIHKSEAALIDANEQLEDRVRQRTLELEDTHRKLIDASRQAGMAEVATDVLHNVGNVLNSVNVATTLIQEKISKSEVGNLQKVTEIIKDNSDNLGTFFAQDKRGMHIPAFLTEVSKTLVDEQADTIDKLGSLAENIKHIKEIVKMQQSYAKVADVEIITSLADLVDNAIQINSAAIDRHGINLVRDFDDLPPVSIDKQRVLQILVNLISNAKYAMVKNEADDKNLIIRIYEHDRDKVRMEVTDNGIGIPKANLTKMFTHGFTTKKNGHGFGLHSGALAAGELRGSLTAHSDGEGKGATFTLELPFKPAKIAQ